MCSSDLREPGLATLRLQSGVGAAFYGACLVAVDIAKLRGALAGCLLPAIGRISRLLGRAG